MINTNYKLFDVVRAPVITEKSTMVAEKNQYIFDVAMVATKKEIKSAVELIYNVKVHSVNTLVRKGKSRVFRGHKGMRSDEKKAYVRLADGHKIDMSAGL